MAISIDANSVIRGAAVVAAVIPLAGASYAGIKWLDPYFQTSPPFAEESKLIEIAQTQAQQQTNLATMQQNQLFLTQHFWINALVQAQGMLRQNPNNAAAFQQQIAAQQALAGIQRQLYSRK